MPLLPPTSASDIFALIAAVGCLCLLVMCLWNMSQFRTLRRAGSLTVDSDSPGERGVHSPGERGVHSPGELIPRISILVPARNEERSIRACVTSLCEQNDTNFEVIVLNDGSTDTTAEILDDVQRQYPQLRIVHGKPLPDGWVGKSWACQQLSDYALGDEFIFTDADTVHDTEMLTSVRVMTSSGDIDAFSIIPHEELGTFAEHVVIPMVHVLYFCYVPNNLIHTAKNVSISAANGQFFWFRRSTYESIGGHRAVQNSMVEDVFLARTVKQAGFRLALVDGSNVVRCRMYTSARDVTDGFSKNLFPATNYNLSLTVIFLLHLLLFYVIPLPLLFTDAVVYACVALASAACIRGLIAWRFAMPLWHVFLQPVTAVWAFVIGIRSIVWAYSPTGPRWKGRSYPTNRTTRS